jgi:hypothetical protein
MGPHHYTPRDPTLDGIHAVARTLWTREPVLSSSRDLPRSPTISCDLLRSPVIDPSRAELVLRSRPPCVQVKNINEFLYGVRAGRTRDTSDGVTEAEPLLHFFWRATHHGVPLEDRLPAADFDFYLDLLTGVATAVGDEHTLNTKGTHGRGRLDDGRGLRSWPWAMIAAPVVLSHALLRRCTRVAGSAFWHLLGSMHEIELPVFLLLNVANNCCNPRGASNPPHTTFAVLFPRAASNPRHTTAVSARCLEPTTRGASNPPHAARR